MAQNWKTKFSTFFLNQPKNFNIYITICNIKHETTALQFTWAQGELFCPKNVMKLYYSKRPSFYSSRLTYDCGRSFAWTLSFTIYCINGLLHRNLKMSHCNNLAKMKRYCTTKTFCHDIKHHRLVRFK